MTRAAAKYDVPLAILYGMTETGRSGSLNPYALNIEGPSIFPANLDEALSRFEAARRDGARLIDIGCMQINHYFHGHKFPSVAAMFDPREGRQLDARGGALPRRARQQSRSKEIRLPGDLQHDRERIWRLDRQCAGVLSMSRWSAMRGLRAEYNQKMQI
jgi:hypothetical protein